MMKAVIYHLKRLILLFLQQIVLVTEVSKSDRYQNKPLITAFILKKRSILLKVQDMPVMSGLAC
jgi:hypothetical protein